jgi:hypothetical protein
MEKGLSRLQKSILKLAYRNRNETYKNGFLHNRDVLIRIYGFQPVYGSEYTRNGSLIFDRQSIGLRRYMAASVATVKAFNRIFTRKLAIRKHNFGVIFTSKGAKIARKTGK